MTYETINYTVKERVGTILLNRPQSLNALNMKMCEELRHLLKLLEEEDSIGILVITGAGRAFCAGGDVKGQRSAVGKVSPLERSRNICLMNEAILSLRELRNPVIASINGPAVGAGFNLALACDMRIASEEARMGASFVRTGLHPDTGSTYFLSRLVGTAKACELIFTGELISAREAERIGLVNRVVEAENLASTVDALARKIANGPPIPIRMAKRLIYKGATMDLAAVLECEMLAQLLCVQTEDHKEGLSAFFEKRAPSFVGR